MKEAKKIERKIKKDKDAWIDAFLAEIYRAENAAQVCDVATFDGLSLNLAYGIGCTVLG